MANLSRAAPADQAIYGEWSGATHHKGREAGEIQQTHFVAWRSELRSCRGYGHELDRAKTVWQVHRKQRYQQDSRHRDAGNRHKRSRKDSKAPAQFNEYRCPCHEMRCWNTQGLENSGKCIRSFGKLGVPVVYEAAGESAPIGRTEIESSCGGQNQALPTSLRFKHMAGRLASATLPAGDGESAGQVSLH